MIFHFERIEKLLLAASQVQRYFACHILRNEPEKSPGTSADYLGRINRAIDHIVQNLRDPLRLDDVAKVACFSPFHFHRVFRSILGETLNQFVNRLRLERALGILSTHPDRSLTRIALDCGFASPSDFSRSFVKRYGVPPSRFDLEAAHAERRCEIQTVSSSPETRHRLAKLPAGENPDGFSVELRELPARCVAYLRVLNSFQPGVVEAAMERMLSWADARGLSGGQWLGYMWDDPKIVATKDCRYDIGLEVSDVKPEGEIGRMEFPAMTVAQIEVKGGLDLEMRAFDWLWGTWLPSSGLVPADHPGFEAWLGRPFAHGHEYFEILLQLPVVPSP